MKRYPEYKESVEWIGEIPNHWSVLPPEIRATL